MAGSRIDPLRVLIAGGGVAAAELLIALRACAGDRVDITLLCPDDELTYRPLSVTAPFGFGSAVRHPIERLAADFGAQRVKGSLSWVAPSAHTAFTDDGSLEYDVLVMATGARRTAAFEHVLTFRGYEDSEEMRELVRDAEQGRAADIAFVVPPHAGWSLPLYELALMTAHRARAAGHQPPRLTIVTPEERPLEVFGDTASAEVASMLAEQGIVFEGGAEPAVPEPGLVQLRPGGRALASDPVVALPRLTGPAIRGLPADDDGFLRTTPFGHVLGAHDVYAAGDGTSFPIKQGGVACQQADVVAEVIARRAGVDVTPSGHRPVLRGVLLTGNGPRWLRHSAPRNAPESSDASDGFLWWPPSKVAGEYLAPYLGEAVAGPGTGVQGRAVISTGRDGGGVQLVTVEQHGSPA